MVRFKMYRQDDVYMQLAPSSPKLSQSETHATFINITHPAQRKEAATRKQVAQYIGVNFRNRSRPSAWREAKGSPSKSGNRKPASPGQLRARGVPIHYWVVDRDFHGLRSDPFGSYPIDPQEWLPEAVDFFLNAYGPTHLLRRGAEDGVSGSKGNTEPVTELSPVHHYFKYSLEHPVMFEALVALSLSHLRVQYWQQGQADKETTYHYSNVLGRLQQTLQEGDGFRETAVLWAILALIELEYLVGNMTAFEAHINGLRRLVDLQGGLASFDQRKLLGPAIRGVLGLWCFLKTTTEDEVTTAAIMAPFSNQSAVTAHLFEACFHGSLNAGLKDFSIGTGLVRLVEERRLSAPVVLQAKDTYDNWEHIDLYKNSPYGVENALNMELRERGWNLLVLWRLHDHGGLTSADYILLIGLQHTLLDTTSAERYSPFYLPVVLRWVSACSHFLDILDPHTDESTVAMLIWVCMKLAGSLTATFLRAQSDAEDDPRFRLMIKMMGKNPEARAWSCLEKLLKTFPWHEHCMNFWREVWRMVVNSDTVERDRYIA